MDQERQVKDMPVYQKAYICPYRNGAPAYESKFYVPFNPSEITIDEAIGVADTDMDDREELTEKWLNGNGVIRQSPLETSYAGKRKRQLTLSTTLFFNTLTSLYQDSYEDVRKYISQLYPYTNKTPDENGKIEQIYFFWGSIAVAGTLNRMNVRYTMFAPDGKPVRAQVDISIVGDYVGEKSHSAIVTSATANVAGAAERDTMLLSITDPSQWRTMFDGTGNPRL